MWDTLVLLLRDAYAQRRSAALSLTECLRGVAPHTQQEGNKLS